MSIVLAGNTTLRLIDSDREWTKRNGWGTVQRYHGLKSDILGLVPLVQEDGFRVRVIDEPGTPNATLEVRADDALDGEEAAEIELNQTWEKITNLLEKDLYTFPGIAATPAARAATIAGIKQAVELVQNGEASVEDYEDAFGNAIANRIYLLKVGGTESYRVPQYVLRRTTTLASSYQDEWPETNILRQWTAEQLIAEYAIPDTRTFHVDEGAWLYQGVLSNTQQSNGGAIVVEEWWHADEWDELLYPARDEALVPEQGGGA